MDSNTIIFLDQGLVRRRIGVGQASLCDNFIGRELMFEISLNGSALEGTLVEHFFELAEQLTFAFIC